VRELWRDNWTALSGPLSVRFLNAEVPLHDSVRPAYRPRMREKERARESERERERTRESESKR